MKRLMYGIAALPLLTSLAFAGQPVQLTDHQMDKVTAGIVFSETDIFNSIAVRVDINQTERPLCGAADCVLSIQSPNFNLQASFIAPPAPPAH